MSSISLRSEGDADGKNGKESFLYGGDFGPVLLDSEDKSRVHEI